LTTILIAIGLTIVLMGLNAATVKVGAWYDALNKPPWNPPKWAFGPAWTVILSLAAWAGVLAWNETNAPEDRVRLVVLFGVNLLLNGLWSQIFFNLRRPGWALVEIAFLLASILSLVLTFYAVSPLAGVLILPYLLWVMFASFLNFTIWRLNRLVPA
jgi:tryptophan-rich sensory protein